MNKYSDQKIIDSWKKNVQPWVVAVRTDEIESRLLVTNKAIIDAVLSQSPKTVLDVGCGEGWLVRELNKVGIKSLGIDAVPKLIEYAQKAGGGRFKVITYESLSSAEIEEKFDVIVCNFSLLGNESVSHLFQQAPLLLNEGGSLIVQTINPLTESREQYKDGWREGSWVGFNHKFRDPAPWYFRTLETWEILFLNNGFKLSKMLEPLNKKTKMSASVIFIGVKSS